MSQADTPQARAAETSTDIDPSTKHTRIIKAAAARATAASMKLEGREVPVGHVRSEGVRTLLDERQSREP